MTPQYIYIDDEGDKFYYKDADMTILHREDGPAVEYTDGAKYWYLNDRAVTKEEHARRNAKTLELTMSQIADKFGIAVENLKIVE